MQKVIDLIPEDTQTDVDTAVNAALALHESSGPRDKSLAERGDVLKAMANSINRLLLDRGLTPGAARRPALFPHSSR